MSARRLAIALALILSHPSPALALQPINEWRIEPSDARCVAVRQFGSADDPVTLAIKAPPTGSSLQLAIIRRAYVRSPEQLGATLRLGDQSFDTFALRYPTNGKKQAVMLFNLLEDAAAATRNATGIEIGVTGGVDSSFWFGQSGAMWTQLDACLERLRDVWNIGEGHEGRIATGPRGDLQGSFSSSDYPLEALRKEYGGTTAFVLLIDETGAVKDCTLTESSGMAVLDARSCGVITARAKFAPAIDVDGKPTKSSWFQRISWRLQ